MNKFTKTIVLGTVFAVPLLALAQSGVNLGAITPYKTGIIDLINKIFVPVLMAIAFIVFLWGVFKYFIWNKESESEKMEGRKYVLWGVVGFVVIATLWALVNLTISLFGLSTSDSPNPPTIRGGSAQSTTNTPAPVTFPSPTSAEGCTQNNLGSSCTKNGVTGTCQVDEFGTPVCQTASNQTSACSPACTPGNECRNGSCFANAALSNCLNTCSGTCNVDTAGNVTCQYSI